MKLIICPGIHDSKLTQSFLEDLKIASCQNLNLTELDNLLIFPTQEYLALSVFHIVQFLQKYLGKPQETSPLIFISFSAGTVGAIGAAWSWQQLGGQVKAFIAIDGWGVPLFGSFPIHRLSHDYFTHWSSNFLGSEQDSFYADPPVEHLQMWRSPQTVAGFWLSPKVQSHSRLSAAEFLIMLLERYKASK